MRQTQRGSFSEEVSEGQTLILGSSGSHCNIIVWYYIEIGSSFSLVGSSSMLVVLATILNSGQHDGDEDGEHDQHRMIQQTLYAPTET